MRNTSGMDPWTTIEAERLDLSGPGADALREWAARG